MLELKPSLEERPLAGFSPSLSRYGPVFFLSLNCSISRKSDRTSDVLQEEDDF